MTVSLLTGTVLPGALFAAVLVSCQRDGAAGTDSASIAAHNSDQAATDVLKPNVPKRTLPRLELRDSTPDLLLTWVGDDGDFHVAESVASVPKAHRSQVRVVQTTEGAGTGSTIYVANLESSEADGTYPVSTMARSNWEALGASLRLARMEAFSPKARTEPPGKSDGPEATAPISAIVYGADWCKPCHQAEAYLKTLDVKVTKKNIEKSRAAQAEMREKLARIKRRGAGIPVIDIMGSLLVGFSKASLKQAVQAARRRVSQTE